MTISKRAVLAGGVAGLGLGLAGVLAAQPRPLRIRRPVSSLRPDDPDLEALRRAIPLMKRAGVWDAQIALHADMRQRHHSSWRFLPWHRLQLVWFERQVARFSGRATFALPFWDWDDDTVPNIMVDDPAFAIPGRDVRRGESLAAFMREANQTFRGRITDDFNTFFGRARNVGVGAGPGYSGSAEWSGHNMIHGFVGGQMGMLNRAPNDPLFWMHHCNIDRIWSHWHARRSDQIYPRQWREEVFQGFTDTNGRIAPAVTAASTIATAGFGYDYEPDPSPPIVFATGPARLLREETLAWAAEVTSPDTARLIVPADAMAGSKVSAIGYLELAPDPENTSVVKITASDRNGDIGFAESIFLVPSAFCESRQGFRIAMSSLWGFASEGDVTLTLQASPLAGRGKPVTTTRVESFILDAEIIWNE